MGFISFGGYIFVWGGLSPPLFDCLTLLCLTLFNVALYCNIHYLYRKKKLKPPPPSSCLATSLLTYRRLQGRSQAWVKGSL